MQDAGSLWASQWRGSSPHPTAATRGYWFVSSADAAWGAYTWYCDGGIVAQNTPICETEAKSTNEENGRRPRIKARRERTFELLFALLWTSRGLMVIRSQPLDFRTEPPCRSLVGVGGPWGNGWSVKMMKALMMISRISEHPKPVVYSPASTAKPPSEHMSCHSPASRLSAQRSVRRC